MLTNLIAIHFYCVAQQIIYRHSQSSRYPYKCFNAHISTYLCLFFHYYAVIIYAKGVFFMYTKPIIYRIYSVAVFVISIIAFLSNIVSILAFYGNFQSVFKYNNLSNSVLTTVVVTSIIVSLIPVFFSYINFSSIFAFAKMIEHEQSTSINPMDKLSYVFPAKLYHSFGSIITGIAAVVGSIGAIILIIVSSVATSSFISLPVIPLAVIALLIFFTYINYFVRYKAFADLYDTLTVKEADEILKNRIKENRTGLMRGYCVFLAIISVIIGIAGLVGIAITFSVLSPIIGIGFTALVVLIEVIVTAIIIICTAILGCYYDNLAKMLEHYMIKYKLLND